MPMKDHLNPSVYDLQRSAIREFSKLASRTPGCVRLTLGEPDQDTPCEIRGAAVASLDAGKTHYIENNGSRELRDKIAGYERDRNGMDYSADEIIVTAGATEALFVSLFGTIEPGDEVIIPSPTFVLYEQIVKLCKGKAVMYDTTADGFQIRSEALGRLVSDRTKAIVLNSPNNPTGTVYDEESLRAVKEAVSGRDIFVICDDVYRSLIYTGNYHSFAEFRELREQIIVIQSFSKPYAMTGWRVGYLMADHSVKERLELIHQYMVVSVPSMFQRACVTALDTDVSGMREEYLQRRDYVLERLDAMGLDVVRPSGAFYVFPSIGKLGMGSQELCTRLVKEAGVALTPGIAFGSDDHVRISYCCSREDLKEGLDRLESFLRKLRQDMIASDRAAGQYHTSRKQNLIAVHKRRISKW